MNVLVGPNMDLEEIHQAGAWSRKAQPLLPVMLRKEAEDKEDVKAVTPKKETGRIHEAGAKKRKEPEEGAATITGNNPPKC